MSFRKMAQFVIDKGSKGSGPRLGYLTFGETAESNSFPTPAFFIHTLAGSIPHISAEVLEYIYPSIPSGEEELRPPLQISVDSTITFNEAVGNFGQGIAKFVGLEGSPVFLTLHNPLYPLRSGHNDKLGIALWSRTGRRSIDSKSHQQIVKDFKPNLFQSLSDYDMNAESSMKRLKNSTSRSIEFLEEITKSGNPKGLFVTVETAWFLTNEEEGNKTLAKILEKQDQIKGFVLNGISQTSKVFVTKDEKTLKLPIEVKDLDISLVQKVISKLPQNIPKYVPGPFSPKQIFELIRNGVDLFDSSFVTKISDTGEVILLDKLIQNGLMPREKLGDSNRLNQLNEDLPKRVVENGNEDHKEELLDFIVSLKDKRFFDDFSPVSKYCSCYSCRNHTRAYINHLFATDELLGPVLLMIHNLTSFSRFFKTIRSNLHADLEEENSSGDSRLDQFKQFL